MKNGSDGSAAASSIPATRQCRISPPRVAREPAWIVRSSRRATPSSSCVRTAQPRGRPRSDCTRATQLPNGLRAASSSSATVTSSRIGLAERHDPVGRAVAGVTAALDRRQAVTRFQPARGGRQVRHRNQYMVELQSGEG